MISKEMLLNPYKYIDDKYCEGCLYFEYKTVNGSSTKIYCHEWQQSRKDNKKSEILRLLDCILVDSKYVKNNK